MSYPGRPPIVPGISLQPSIGIPPYMPPMLPMTMQSSNSLPRSYGSNSSRSSSTSKYSYSAPPRKAEAGPAITVFVGNIIEHGPDLMVRHILNACGQVLSWKRIQGFGFCEFGSPESALRAVRLLHDLEVGSKRLVVKVDAKTKVLLDEYKKEERAKQGKPELKLKDNEEMKPEAYLNDNMRRLDLHCQEKVHGILEDFEEEIRAAQLEMTEEAKLKKEIQQNLPDKNKTLRNTEMLNKLCQEHDENPSLKDTDIEDGKRDIISREIGKFREIMKKQEAAREEERQRRELLEKQRIERGEKPNDRGERGRSRSTPKSASPSRSQTKSPSPPGRHRRKERNRSRSRYGSPRDRSPADRPSVRRSRERDRDRNDRERDRDKDRVRRDMDRASAREKEEEEEAKERRKLEKKAREKEVSYQERLRAWEGRERRKNKEFEKEKERERYKEDEMAREAKKLKEFLEDYDDERDDSKYYKSRELAKKLADREREKELDHKDRQREKEEVEELRVKIMEEEPDDPTGAYERLLKEREEQYKPKILIDVNAEQMRQREREREREEREKQRLREMEREREKEEIRMLEEERRMAERELAAQAREEEEEKEEEDERNGDSGGDVTPGDGGVSRDSSGRDPSPAPASPAESLDRRSPHGQRKKKKLDVREVFNTDDDEDSNLGSGKRRKLVPLDYGDDKGEHKKKKDKDKDKDKDKQDDIKDESGKTQEEKRKHIKTLIDKIPTDKGALFGFSIDWTAVDNHLMERRIRPWINKKIIEYIGEPEPTLVDFICSKVLAGSQPQGILDDVQMVLDEEAEVFVVKMWRLLIYEIEAKKLGLVK